MGGFKRTVFLMTLTDALNESQDRTLMSCNHTFQCVKIKRKIKRPVCQQVESTVREKSSGDAITPPTTKNKSPTTCPTGRNIQRACTLAALIEKTAADLEGTVSFRYK